MCNQTVNQEHKVLCIQFTNKCNWPIKKDYIRIITWSTLMEDDIHESVFDGRKQTMNRWNQLHDLEKRKCRWRCWLRQNGVKKIQFHLCWSGTDWQRSCRQSAGVARPARGWGVWSASDGRDWWEREAARCSSPSQRMMRKPCLQQPCHCPCGTIQTRLNPIQIH